MDRRNFLRSLVGGVAVASAVRTWPFRVYSFPTDLRIGAPLALELENARELIPDLLRPSFLIKQGSLFGMSTWDGADLGRGSATSYMRVGPYDDLNKLFAEGWRDPRCLRIPHADGTVEWKNLSRSSKPFRVGVT